MLSTRKENLPHSPLLVSSRRTGSEKFSNMPKVPQQSCGTLSKPLCVPRKSTREGEGGSACTRSPQAYRGAAGRRVVQAGGAAPGAVPPAAGGWGGYAVGFLGRVRWGSCPRRRVHPDVGWPFSSPRRSQGHGELRILAVPSLPAFLHPQHRFAVHQLPAPVSGVDPGWSSSWGWWLLCVQ